MRDEQKGIWIVGSMTNGVLSFSEDPRQHVSGIDATSEAQRLATSHPGKTFVVAKIEKKHRATWLCAWENV